MGAAGCKRKEARRKLPFLIALVLCALSQDFQRQEQRRITRRTEVAFVGQPLQSRLRPQVGSWREEVNRGVIARAEFNFNMSDRVDRTEYQLCNQTLKLTSSVYGFADYDSLVDLIDNGTIRFYGGMVSKQLGGWYVDYGNAEQAENPEDLYLEFLQPLTERYVKDFEVPGQTCVWRGRLDLVKTKDKIKKVRVDGGVVTCELEGNKIFRQGVFTAESVTAAEAFEVRQKAMEAFERALTTPKSETTGFKTPARIAGAKGSRPRKVLPAPAEKGDLDLLEDGNQRG